MLSILKKNVVILNYSIGNFGSLIGAFKNLNCDDKTIGNRFHEFYSEDKMFLFFFGKLNNYRVCNDRQERNFINQGPEV